MLTEIAQKEKMRAGRLWFYLMILGLFFLSGISGLIYEVVWTRLLTYLFGATIYAVSTVLASFMGGLALGSLIFGRLADRWEHKSLKAYALLESGIGIAAILLLIIIRALEPVYGVVYRHGTNSFLLLSLVRFILCFIALLLPTTLMGGTLPLLSRFVARQQRVLGLRVGALYSVNTFGAVVGCFLAGFYFIAGLGIRGTILLAVGINFTVALIGLWLWKKLSVVTEGTPENLQTEASSLSGFPEYDYKLIKKVLWLYFFAGMIALAYQVGWWRGLVFNFDVLKNTTYAFTAMLTVFLIGLASGSAVMARFVDRQHDPLRLFGLLQVFIGLAGYLSVFVIYFKGRGIAPFEYFDASGVNLRWWNAIANIFIKTIAAIFLPTFLMGMSFPVVVRICISSLKRVGAGVGKIYALNTLGCIIGAFIAGFFLIPFLGLGKGLIFLALGNVLLGFVIFLIHPELTRRSKNIFIVLIILIIALMLLRSPMRATLQPVEEAESLLFYKEGPLATVAVVETLLGYRTLYVDNVGVAGTDPIMLTDQKSLAHVPLLLLPEATSVLTVGFGSGGASWSYTLYSSLQQIHCVEICPTVLEAAPYLLDSNHGILELNDPRYRIIIDDVRSYLRFTDQLYDVIATDCTDLRYKTNANLYDYEYFQLCRRRLTDRGMVVVWTPLAGLTDKDFRMTLRTFYKVFPEMSVWYMNNEPTHYILLVGTKMPLRINYREMQVKLQDPKIKADLAELNLDDVDKILSCFIVGADKTKAFLGEGLINTENHPYIEFDTPKQGYGEQPLINNLKTLLKFQSDVNTIIEHNSILPEQRERLQKFVSAVPDIIEGICAYRLLQFEAAAKAWMQAKARCPEDRAIQALLEFSDLRRRIERFPLEGWTKFALAKVLFIQQRNAEAATWYKRFVDLYRNIPMINLSATERQQLAEAYTDLASIYQQSGYSAEAEKYSSLAKQLK